MATWVASGQATIQFLDLTLSAWRDENSRTKIQNVVTRSTVNLDCADLDDLL